MPTSSLILLMAQMEASLWDSQEVNDSEDENGPAYEQQLAHLNFVQMSVKIRKIEKILRWVLTLGVCTQ